jgi:hypothetical protein
MPTNEEAFHAWRSRNRQSIARLQQQIRREKAQAQIGAPTVRQTGGTGMDTLTQAQTAWQADFSRLLDHALTSYHFAENAQDRRRTNTKAEEERELSHRATVKADAHTDAVRHLTEWVKARPYPATDQTAQADEEAGAETHPPSDIVQYRNGWEGAMVAVEDTMSRHTGADARAYADRLRLGSIQTVRAEPSDDYARGTVHAMTHFLNTGQTDNVPQIV